jgi:transcription-repair coupling factor (superfamily II helicase)
MYCQILENAIRLTKGEPIPEPPQAHLKLNVKAYIPDGYIQGERQKLEMYRKLSRVTEMQQVADIEKELKDRYGEPPREVKNLLEKSRLSLMAKTYRIASIFTQDNVLVITGKDPALLKKALGGVRAEVRFIDEMTAHVVMRERSPSGGTLLRFLKMCLKS